MPVCWICRSPEPEAARFCSQCGVALGRLTGARAAPGAGAPSVPPLRHHATAAGPRLAYALTGEGPRGLVIVPGLVTHLAYDWQVPDIRGFYERLASGRRLLRYDRLGGGLSDRVDQEYDAAAEARDLRDLLVALRLGPADVFGWSQGALAAVALAAQHPECVARVVLCMGNPVGPGALDPPDAAGLARSAVLRQLIGVDFDVACRAIIDALFPDLDPGWARWIAAYMRMAMPPEGLLLRRAVADRADVRALLPRIAAPTLVLRRADEPLLPRHRDPLTPGDWAEGSPGQYLAQHIPGARLVDLPCGWHLPFLGETEPMHAAVAHFLAEAAPGPGAGGAVASLTQRERDVLRWIAQGCSNREIAVRLGCSPSTVKRHAENIYGKLGVSGRSAAAALAAAGGLGRPAQREGG